MILTETYMVVDAFKTIQSANNFAKYLGTDFSRYLLGLRKITQHIPADRWCWVPYMDNSRAWTDKELFEYFSLTEEEQKHIKKKVEEWS